MQNTRAGQRWTDGYDTIVVVGLTVIFGPSRWVDRNVGETRLDVLPGRTHSGVSPTSPAAAGRPARHAVRIPR